jgi:hypothetical protein
MADRDTTLYPKNQDLLISEMDKRLREAGRRDRIVAIENFLVRNTSQGALPSSNIKPKRKK